LVAGLVRSGGNGGEGVLGPALDRQRDPKVLDHSGVLDHGDLGHPGDGPADGAGLGHGQAEFVGEGGVPAVVVLSLPARVLDPAGVGQGMRGLVQ
jgi:hypothetical protein